MKKSIFLVGLLGLFFGVFIYDYTIPDPLGGKGISIITVISSLIIFKSFLEEKNESKFDDLKVEGVQKENRSKY